MLFRSEVFTVVSVVLGLGFPLRPNVATTPDVPSEAPRLVLPLPPLPLPPLPPFPPRDQLEGSVAH